MSQNNQGKSGENRTEEQNKEYGLQGNIPMGTKSTLLLMMNNVIHKKA